MRNTRLILLAPLVLAVSIVMAGCSSSADREGLPTLGADAVQSPTVTTEPTAAPPTQTPPPTNTPLPSPTPEPSNTPDLTAPQTTLSASTGSAGANASRPRGSSAQYEPEYPAVRPAGGPPDFDAQTNPLTGQRVEDPAVLQRRPLLIRYGNDQAARPHAGISRADVVTEELMDAWWITRITAVFLQDEPARVGPLRSARPLHVDLIQAFDAVFVYSGVSTGVSRLLAQYPFNLINENREADLLYRDGSRPAPHNLFTSVPRIRERLAQREIDRSFFRRGFAFSDEVPSGQAVERVDIPYPSNSAVSWTWDAAAGLFRRWVQGRPYIEAETGKQVAFENVVILYAQHWETDLVEDSLGARAIGIALQGGERAQILRDGQLIEGWWWRADPAELFRFLDDSGQDIPLKPGRTWIQFVPVSYEMGIR